MGDGIDYPRILASDRAGLAGLARLAGLDGSLVRYGPEPYLSVR